MTQTWTSASSSALLIATFFAGVAFEGKAQSQVVSAPLIVEDPPSLITTIEDIKREAFAFDHLDMRTKGIINELTGWGNRDMPLSVCFLDGGPEAREKVRMVAIAWSDSSNQVSFDFGNGFYPQDCEGRKHQIRISFEGQGVSSSSGSDSMRIPSYQPSMILGRFDTDPPEGKEFNRWVIHEFGHALGFVHEHQGTIVNCTSEYKIDLLYDSLRTSPYFWDKPKVDQNLRQLFLEAPLTNGFDPESIMLYSFEKKFYKTGTNSPCFHEPVYEPSENDIALSSIRYPASLIGVPYETKAQRTMRLTSELKQNIDALDIPSDIKMQTINSIPEWFTDR